MPQPRPPGIGHDGAATGQYAYLRVIPEQGVAIALLTNGGGARPLSSAILREMKKGKDSRFKKTGRGQFALNP